MSIELKLQAILETKAALQAALNLPNSVPFSQYAGRINWKDETPPSDLLFADYTKDRYSVSGVPVGFSDVNEFIRLSSATKWQDGQLVEVQDNTPRISGEGLLIEEQRTNLQHDSQTLSKAAKEGVTLTYDAYAPLGAAVNFYKMTETTTTGSHRLIITGQTASATGPHCVSLIIKITENRYRIRLLQSTGSGLFWTPFLNLRSGVIPDGWIVQQLGIDLFRVTFTFDVLSLGKLAGYVYLLNDTEATTTAYQGDGESHIFIAAPQLEDDSFPTSYIPTSGTPVTRSPDILNIPLLPTQSPTGDWDAGVTYTVADGIATFSGHGYIRNISVEEL